MNRLCYRIVFNKQRGALMAVAETAHSQSQRGGQKRARRKRRGSHAARGLGGLLLACALGLGTHGAVVAQIRADASAPKMQQPTVLTTANGLPLVNIQTPSAAGVSRNTYSQFDVQANGAVLNNARGDAVTQLGGWVQGNPWLARGGARVILNEVNSTAPSQLKGFLEIAGQRAQLIIASPSGIQVDGSGFINASSAILSTGTPRFGTDGTVAGLAVQGGAIRIEGSGLDASQTDYTAVQARAIDINAGLWAKDLRITTGRREMGVDGTPRGDDLPAIGQAPRYALDSSALGGMYAQRISLVGTEAGLGVRHAGQMAAQQLVLQVDGWLHNSGTMHARGEGASLQIEGREGIRNEGWIASQGALSLQGQRLQSTAGSVTAAGLQEDGKLAGDAGLRLQADDGQEHHGLLMTPSQMLIQAPSLDLTDASAQAGELLISGDSMRADRARLQAQTLLSVQMQRDLSTPGGQPDRRSVAARGRDGGQPCR